jgi:REP element-mobilizing transposase RayT
MELSDAGHMANEAWSRIPGLMVGITIDCHVIMPNHAHALVGISVDLSDPEERSSLTDVIHRYKSTTTTLMIRGVKERGWPKFDRRLWQSGFHDRIVRSERELETFRHYIATNPERWDEDTFHVDS